MLEESGYKRILSQLFDVKPMRNSVDLDWESIWLVKKTLNLRGIATKKEMSIRREALILNRPDPSKLLREKETLIFVKGDDESLSGEAVNINKEIDNSHLLFDDYFSAVGTKNEKRDRREFSDDLFEAENERSVESIDEYDLYFEDREKPKNFLNDNFISREEALRELEEFYRLDDETEKEENFPDVCSEDLVDYTQEQDKESFDQNIEDGNGLLLEPGSRFFAKEDKRYLSRPPFYARIGLLGVISAAFIFFSFSSIFYFFNSRGSFPGNKLSSSIIESGDFNLENSLENIRNGDSRSLGDFFSLLNIAGDNYLLVLQDASETRPTGGAIKYYGSLNFKDDKINLYTDDVFNIDSQLQAKIVPPRPIQKISTAWGMHDANWFPDFSASAKKLIWFYDNASGKKTDGVISFSSESIKKILDVAGPIDLPDYELIVSAENLAGIINIETKDDFDSVLSKPVNIFSGFISSLLDKINNSPPELKEEIMESIVGEMNKKNILVFFTDDSAEKFVISRGWGGVMKDAKGDFLNIIEANLSGCPVDFKINNGIKHFTEIKSDGSIVDKLIIEKDGRNITEKCGLNHIPYYLRIYVPEGSELLSVDGNFKEDYKPPLNYGNYDFQYDLSVKSVEDNARIHSSGVDVYTENGKTVFGGWLYLPVNGKSVMVYEYKLPFRLNEKDGSGHSLTVQKQSGSIGGEFIGIVNVSDKFAIENNSDNLVNESPGVYKIINNLADDFLYSISLGSGH